MKKSNRLHLYAYFGIAICFLLSLFWVFGYPTKQVLTVEMYYHNAAEGTVSQLFWAENGELSAENCSDGSRDVNTVLFDLPQSPDELTMVRVDPTNTDEPYLVMRIAFLLNGEYFYAQNAQELLENAVPVNATFSMSEGEVLVTPTNNDSGILISDPALQNAAQEASASLHSLLVRQRFFAMLALAVCLALLVRFANPLWAFISSFFKKDESGKFDWFGFFAAAVMAGALLCVFVIGLVSELGLHPDEWDVKACLDYGMTHFFPPDMRDSEVASTYSGYGYTKLENYTWYFYLAGKVALLFQTLFCSLQYYRIPNLLLFLALAFFFVYNVRKKNWLMAAFGVCVQAWYIFSYTTADALDFVWSFIAVYELSEENSLLYRTVDAKRWNRRTVAGILAFGALFGMIVLGKQNYYAILALAFFVLVYRLAQQKDKTVRKANWRNYFAIVGVFAAVFLFRYSFDLVHYGTQKADVKEEVAILYADYDKNPATPVEEQSVSWHMYEKGEPITAVFTENPEWFSMSFKSLCGLLQDTDTGSWYFITMGILYAAILLSIGIAVFQNGGGWDKLTYVTGIALIAGGLVASILNSWLIDSMAQGRYLLPSVLIAGFLASRVPQLFEKKSFRALLCVAGVLSVGYFGLVGVRMFL